MTAALAVLLSACGNKGPLVQASQSATPVPQVPSPAATDPTDAAPSDEIMPPPAADPAGTTTPAEPVGAGADGSGGGD